VRPGLVAEPGGLPSDPQLDQHHVRVRDARDEVGGGPDPARVPGAREHPLRDPGDELRRRSSGIHEPELVDRSTSRSREKPSVSSGV
jgi:hypothetical protein